MMDKPFAGWHEPSGLVGVPGAKTAGFGSKDKGPGWKVAIRSEGTDWFLPLKFGREVDAKRAAESIVDIIDWSGSPSVIVERLQEFGLDRLRRTMIESLGW